MTITGLLEPPDDLHYNAERIHAAKVDLLTFWSHDPKGRWRPINWCLLQLRKFQHLKADAVWAIYEAVESKGFEIQVVDRQPDFVTELRHLYQWQARMFPDDEPRVRVVKVSPVDDYPALFLSEGTDDTDADSTGGGFTPKREFYHLATVPVPEDYKHDGRDCGPLEGSEDAMAFAVTGKKSRDCLRRAARGGTVFVQQESERKYKVFFRSFQERNEAATRLENR